MKHRLSKNEEVVREWVARAPQHDANNSALRLYSRGNRILSDGHVLYSYGRHYPLARWCPDQKIFLVNTKARRSQSTSKHQCYVRRHVGSNHIEVGEALTYSPTGNPEGYIERWTEMLQDLKLKAQHARSRKSHYLEEIRHITAAQNQFVRSFHPTAANAISPKEETCGQIANTPNQSACLTKH